MIHSLACCTPATEILAESPELTASAVTTPGPEIQGFDSGGCRLSPAHCQAPDSKLDFLQYIRTLLTAILTHKYTCIKCAITMPISFNVAIVGDGDDGSRDIEIPAHRRASR